MFAMQETIRPSADLEIIIMKSQSSAVREKKLLS